MVIFFNFLTTSNHLHPLQVENCDSNSPLVVDEDDNVKSDLRLQEIQRMVEDVIFRRVILLQNRGWPRRKKEEKKLHAGIEQRANMSGEKFTFSVYHFLTTVQNKVSNEVVAKIFSCPYKLFNP